MQVETTHGGYKPKDCGHIQEVARLSDTDLESSKVWDAVANTRRTRKTNTLSA